MLREGRTVNEVEIADRLARIETSMEALRTSAKVLAERLGEHLRHEDALINHATVATDRMMKLELEIQALQLKQGADTAALKQRIIYMGVIGGLVIAGSGGTLLSKLLTP